MPGQGYTFQTGSVALSASATKSLILLNPVDDRCDAVEFGVSFDGSAAGAGIRVELYRVTTLGTPAGTAGTAVKRDENDPAAEATALTALTTEPTAVEVYKGWFVTPFGGTWAMQVPLDREFRAKAAGARIGVRVITPASVSPNADAYIEYEE